MASTSQEGSSSTAPLRRVRSTGDIHANPRRDRTIQLALDPLTPDGTSHIISPENGTDDTDGQARAEGASGESAAATEGATGGRNNNGRGDVPLHRVRRAPTRYHRYSEGHEIFRHHHFDRPISDIRDRPPVMMRPSQIDTRIRPVPLPPFPMSPRAEHIWTTPPDMWTAPPNETQPEPYVPPNDMPEPMPANISRHRRIMTYFGYGRYASKVRKALVSLMWTLSFGIVQIVAIITLLVYAASRQSPTMPGYNEWQACDRPLGLWDAIWVAKVLMGCSMGVWGWTRDRTVRLNSAAERLRQNASNSAEAGHGSQDIYRGSPTGATSPRTVLPLHSQDNSNASATHGSASNTNDASARPHAILYSRMSFLSTLLTLAWFLTAHILEYTSVNTCRHSSPHLWWLTFGILCIMYLTVLEVIIIGLVVFVIGPLIFLFWNILLIILGRHPLQNPHYIKPEIGKLSRSIVDRIPLVLYIPPPPDEPTTGQIAYLPQIYSYPPKPSTATPAPRRRRRFAFLRKFPKVKGKGAKKSGDGNNSGKNKMEDSDQGPATWEDNWEQGEYPFVRLEGNRAACAICLMDFDEPKRIHGASDTEKKAEAETDVANGDKGGSGETEVPMAEGSPETGAVEEVRVDEVTEEERQEILKLTDAGEGPQPLRLLGCGHVFHKTCLDPWLTDVSGRCPVCQRPVELASPEDKK